MAKRGEAETLKRLNALYQEYFEEVVRLRPVTIKEMRELAKQWGFEPRLLETLAKGADYAAVAQTQAVTLSLYDTIPAIFPEVNRKIISMSWTDDNINLSQRVHGINVNTQRFVKQQVREAISQKKSIRDAALSIFEGYDFRPELPRPAPVIRKELKELAELSKKVGSGTQFNALVKPQIEQVRQQVGTLVTQNLRTAYNELLNAIENGGRELIDKAYYVAVQEKSRYYATRVARTEIARADFEGFMVDVEEDEDVVGIKYYLSTQHSIADICDIHTGVNFGYGRGVYPIRSTPPYPFHPHCACNYEQVFVSPKLDRDMKASGEAFRRAGNEYLESIPEGKRAKIMGVKRSIEFDQMEDKDWRSLQPNYRKLHNPSENIRFVPSDFAQT